MAGGLPTGPDVRLAGDSGGILLRRADARDAGRVAALSGQLGYPAAEEAIRERLRAIGRALMERAEAWAWDMGLAAVRLRSNVIRAEAHAFYARIGYAPVKTQKVFAKELREET